MPLFVIRIPARKIMKANKRTSFLGFVNVATLTPRYEPGMEPATRNITRQIGEDSIEKCKNTPTRAAKRPNARLVPATCLGE